VVFILIPIRCLAFQKLCCVAASETWGSRAQLSRRNAALHQKLRISYRYFPAALWQRRQERASERRQQLALHFMVQVVNQPADDHIDFVGRWRQAKRTIPSSPKWARGRASELSEPMIASIRAA
jgi:hypothetical protein